MTLLWDVSQCHAATQQVFGGSVISKHSEQQIGTEEHQQSTAAMHLTDCSDNRQGKHPHRERKIWTEGAEKEKRDVKCETEREERGGRLKKREEDKERQ